ncbi:MAG: flagellar basal-body MS-ring/collar protein FliF [Eubacteriales bacterium]
MGRLKTVLIGAQNGWTSMERKKRISLIVILICTVLFASIISFYTTRIEYTALFTNLELSDAGNIADDLESRKIAYKLENGGKDILIDAQVVDEYRLQLAMNGMMPENSTGFEIFDDIGLMVTDEDREIMYQRALSGELQRSIMSMEAINSAKVLLVMAEDTIFDTEEKEASASVILDIKTQYQVTDDMIQGITALVSGAVKNLPTKNVQVINSKGELLSENLQENDTTNAVDVIDGYEGIRNSFESKLEGNINDLLGSIYGRDKIKISVYADMDFDSEESTLISYENPVVRSEQVSASGGSIDVQDVTGGVVDDNTSNVIQGDDGDTATYDKTVNNELTTETTTTVKAPGKILKLTTSVVYDGTLSPEDITSIRNIVSTATGYDINRGDMISVEGLVFDKTYEEELKKELEAIKMEEEASKSIFEKYGDMLMFGLLAVLSIIMIIAFIRFLLVKRRPREDLAVQQLAMDVPIGGSINMTDDFNEKLEVQEDTRGTKVKEYATEHPDIAADLIKAWLKD